jgi:hypothetical protein
MLPEPCHARVQHEAKWTKRAIEFFNDAAEATSSVPAAPIDQYSSDPVVSCSAAAPTGGTTAACQPRL